MRHQRRIVAIGALVVAGAAGAIGFRQFSLEAKAQTALRPLPPPVQLAVARREDVPVYLTGLGTVQAYNTVTVRVQVDGQLQKVMFTEGQFVRRGDVLAQIDPSSFQAAFDQASAKMQQDQANLSNAQVTLERDEKLAKQDFASVQDLDDQRSTVEQLKAQISQDRAAKDAAAVQLSYTRLTAPLDGRTGTRLVDEGNIVHATDAQGLVVITQTRPISVISTLPEDDLPLVRDALTAGPVTVTALTGDATMELGSGTLSLINNQIDQANGTIQLKSTFPNADEKLWPGQFVSLRLQQQVVKDALTVPSAALQRSGQGFFVYVVGPDDVLEAREIAVGQIASGRAIVKQGLADGEKVVSSGFYRIEPGVRVAVREAPAPVAAADDR